MDKQLRILKPQYICLAPVEEGDVAMWDDMAFSTLLSVIRLRSVGPDRCIRRTLLPVKGRFICSLDKFSLCL